MGVGKVVPTVSWPVTAEPKSDTPLGGELEKLRAKDKMYHWDEDTASKFLEPFYREVFEFALILESEQAELVRAEKEVNMKLLEDLYSGGARGTTSLTRTKKVKEYMCPLGLKCPCYYGDRWPVSDKNKGTTP